MPVTPSRLLPMLATKGDHVPGGAEWSHEVKWDGVRVLASVPARGADGGSARLVSRNGNDVSLSWPDVTDPACRPARLHDAVFDGEIIAMNPAGVPDFRVLQERVHVRNAQTVARLVTRVPVTFMVFDVLRLGGRDLTGQPLETRRSALTDALDGGAWQVPPAYDDGAMLFDATRAQGLEGIVSKRRDSRYRPGERSAHWLKFAHRHRGSFVVGGWRPQEGTRDRLAALLVGEPTPSGLHYRGRVGSGIGPAQGRVLAGLVAGLERADSPFADGEHGVPRADAVGTRWVEPVLVVDVDTHGLGYERLRQPSFQGVRADLTPESLLGDRTGEEA
ncbi:non-homologous end-joining DNA ligase [Nocardioides sp. R-C-SC26]|uniref:non-homologous end-joining DNA ligase n=1 Tax=Nocardioides sp. R-C-SC26 TaxID=2870414 RepID=UPI001E4A25CB|nr:non-homologous end-joining DNA ligase [Nocardioides sp. R-C-SC26]